MDKCYFKAYKHKKLIIDKLRKTLYESVMDISCDL